MTVDRSDLPSTPAEAAALGRRALLDRVDQLTGPDPRAAIMLCELGIAAFARNARFHAIRGALLVDAERWDKAEGSLGRAIKLDPTDFKSLARLARVRISQGRFQKAAALLKEAVAQQRGDVWPLREELAHFRLVLHDYETAAREIGEALAQAPDPRLRALLDQARQGMAADSAAGVQPYARRRVQMAMELLRAGEPAEAEARIAPIVAEHPRLADAWTALWGAWHAQGETAKAAGIANAWAAADPASKPLIRMSTSRALSGRGLLFDPREPFPLRGMEAALRRAATPAELHQGPDGYLMIDPGGRSIRHEPIIGLADDGSDVYALDTRTSPSFVLSLANAALVDRGVAVTAANEVIGESLLPKWRAKCHSVVRDGALHFDPAYFADGGCAVTWFDTPAFVMAGPTDLHFGDWMYNFVPRLHLAEAARLDVPIVVNADLPGRYVEMLGALGAPRSRLLFRDPGGVSIFPRLYVPSWPSPTRFEPMEGQDRVYARAATGSASGRRELLFLSRRNFSKRALVNEAEVRELFVARGFRVICPEEETLAQSFETFAQPACVAGPYGSAFRNVVFNREPPVGFLLMPPDVPTFVEGSALFLAQAGVRFGYVNGRLAPGFERADPRRAPWIVDIEEVAAKLDRFLEVTGMRPMAQVTPFT
jgi:tetratricopeptide (TPR) repeat protein